MNHVDLGRLEGEIIAFGGPVSNAEATSALLAVAAGRHLICTGDVAAYCAGAEESVRLLRASGATVIRGNCEESLGDGAADCGCGFEAGTVCDTLSGAWYAHALRDLSMESRDWMRARPAHAVFEAHGLRWGVLHGGATAINRFIWPVDPDDVFREEIAALESELGPLDAILSGHSGIPFRRDIDRHVWFNAGAIGMPPNDGDPRTAYGVIGPNGPHIERLTYDWKSAADAMRRAGLVQGYDRCLENGWWPSEDVLPEALRRAA